MTVSNEFPANQLSVDRYFNLLGFDPIQAFQSVTSLRNRQNCDDVLFQFGWQNDGGVSREELKQVIKQAENDLTHEVRYFPAPRWYSEVLDYPQYYQRELKTISGSQVGGFNNKTLNTNRKYVISGGQRATSKIDSADIVRGSDIDTTGDGFNDTAVFDVTVDFTNKCELKCYIKEFDALDVTNTRTDPSSESADPYWEVRSITKKQTGSVVTVYVPVYLLFKPQLQRRIDAVTLDADDSASYVDTVEFYRVYNDPSGQVTFLWTSEGSCSSTACAYATQAGCMRVKDSRAGIVAVQPGAWDSDTETFTSTKFSMCREPDKVIVNYYSGFQDETARNCDELSYWWAYTIAMLASARLMKDVCKCENAARLIDYWQEDVSLGNDVRNISVNFDDLSNPFGTRRGELMAYNRLESKGVRVGKCINTY